MGFGGGLRATQRAGVCFCARWSDSSSPGPGWGPARRALTAGLEQLELETEEAGPQHQDGPDLAPGPLVVGSQEQLALCETPGQMEAGLV